MKLDLINSKSDELHGIKPKVWTNVKYSLRESSFICDATDCIFYIVVCGMNTISWTAVLERKYQKTAERHWPKVILVCLLKENDIFEQTMIFKLKCLLCVFVQFSVTMSTVKKWGFLFARLPTEMTTNYEGIEYIPEGRHFVHYLLWLCSLL